MTTTHPVHDLDSMAEARPDDDRLDEPLPTARTRARWEIPALVALLVGTAVLYLWDLSASAWGNSFYAAASQAGSQSWKAFLYGASDAAGSITVDKPPASLWPSALAVRVFGLSSWSILAPQSLMGVASVALLWDSVRRRFSAAAGLLAGAALALTPVAALMFRFNNPDALLVLLLIGSVWATMRAVQGGRTTRWMAVAGVLVGFAFLTKQLQAFLVLPGLALAFLWAAPVSFARRVRDGFVAVGAMVLAAGWWIALVELVPASWRPYVGGSQDNSFLELTFGYNGFGRITGDETGSVGGGRSSQWGTTGLGRLFGTDIGGQIAWLVPAALVLGVAALWLRRRFGRTDPGRAEILAWGSWLVVTGVVFSFMGGIFHQYYTVALAPAVAALVGIGAVEVWRRRPAFEALLLLAVVTLGTAAWSFVLLGRSADWMPWLRGAVLVFGALGAVLLLVGHVAGRAVLGAGAVASLVAGLAGPTAYTLQTVSTPHTGSIVTAGPSVSTGGNGGPGFGGGRGGGPGAQGGGQGGPNGQQGGRPGQGGSTQGGNGLGNAPGGQAQGGQAQGGRGGMGGLLNGSSVSTEVEQLLLEDADEYTWVAATVGSQNAASYQLATQHSVMPIGGFNGTDPSPTLEQFQQDVADGTIHWFIGSGSLGSQNGGSSAASDIAAWVADSFTAQTVDGTTMYDLSGGASSASSGTSTSSGASLDT
ncbi:glycosyltransferase family 39 protein [Cellulomonas sp. JH27-2]|uniref:ArnT family glycosyltransferase n=1 Tax=Cellulomonas sp. JH27-2 TaxID=2774139 RepID=UPI00177D0090|nr:glycosyltransferase family 39 protein [Cellulomonas sp. JH27-2]MBD8059326.1 glycosyltransferase family 39 protein [Cellulomonas sp. JH27-2]